MIFWSNPDMCPQRFQQIVADVVKSLIAALFAASVETGPQVAAGFPWEFNPPHFKGGELPPPPQAGSTIDPTRFGLPTADTAGGPAGASPASHPGARITPT